MLTVWWLHCGGCTGISSHGNVDYVVVSLVLVVMVMLNCHVVVVLVSVVMVILTIW